MYCKLQSGDVTLNVYASDYLICCVQLLFTWPLERAKRTECIKQTAYVLPQV